MNETAVRESVITDVRIGSQVSWGAIIAGWVVAAGVAWLFYQLGAAIGLTVADPAQDDAAALGKGLSIGAGVWVVLTWMVSLFAGGWYAGRMAGRATVRNGALHGVAVWGFTAVLSIIVGFIGLTNIAQGGASLIGGTVQMGAAGASKAAESSGGQGSTALEAEIKQAISQNLASAGGGSASRADINQAMNQLDSKTLASISGRLLRGDTEGAKNVIAINTTLNRQQVDSVISGLAAQVPRYKAEVEQKAQAATKYTSALLWTTFISTLLALGFSMWGGAVGARNAARATARYDVAQNY